MKLLAIESSGAAAGAAVWADGKVISEKTGPFKITHSETLMPLIDEALKESKVPLSQLSCIAFSGGPGSFTGLRVGCATAKGLALALDLPLVHVPTLDAIAYNLYGEAGLIVPIMDARRGQVYTGIYKFVGIGEDRQGCGRYVNNAVREVNSGETEITAATEVVVAGEAVEAGKDAQHCRCGLRILLPSCAVSAEELVEKINEFEDGLRHVPEEKPVAERVTFLGDGVPAFKEFLKKAFEESGRADNLRFEEGAFSLQRASSVARLGAVLFEEGKISDADREAPVYLRVSQAERVRAEKLGRKG